MRNGALTVGELIEKLQELDNDYTPVFLHTDDWDTQPVTRVWRGLMEVVIS